MMMMSSSFNNPSPYSGGGGTPSFGAVTSTSTSGTLQSAGFVFPTGSTTTIGSNNTPPAMSEAELQELCALVEAFCGIHLDGTKRYLLETRLLKLLLESGCNTYGEFITLCKGPRQRDIKPKVVDAMTTKETLWFRDEHPFETLKQDVLPYLLEANPPSLLKPFRIWSAACSTGQEPYSLSMTLNEFASTHSQYNNLADGKMARIVATDIAPSALTLARMARYDTVAMARGLSELRKQRFFEPQGRVYTLKEEVKRIVEFQSINLHEEFGQLGLFDLICIRNVAIYFSQELKEKIYARMAKQLKPNGLLLLGCSESMVGLSTPFKGQLFGRSTFYKVP
jgi:chemotaxis protein methyltransferase CheR